MASRRRVELRLSVFPQNQTLPASRIYLDVRIDRDHNTVYRDSAGIETLVDTRRSPEHRVFSFYVPLVDEFDHLGPYIFHELFAVFREDEFCNFLTHQILSFLILNPSVLEDCSSFSTLAYVTVTFTLVIEDGGPGNNNGVSASFLCWLRRERRLHSDNSKIGEGVDCSICLQRLSGGEELIDLPCRHLFHESCIIRWLANHNTCPLCREVFDTD